MGEPSLAGAGEGVRADVKVSDLFHTIKSPKINRVTEKFN